MALCSEVVGSLKRMFLAHRDTMWVRVVPMHNVPTPARTRAGSGWSCEDQCGQYKCLYRAGMGTPPWTQN